MSLNRPISRISNWRQRSFLPGRRAHYEKFVFRGLIAAARETEREGKSIRGIPRLLRDFQFPVALEFKKRLESLQRNLFDGRPGRFFRWKMVPNSPPAFDEDSGLTPKAEAGPVSGAEKEGLIAANVLNR